MTEYRPGSDPFVDDALKLLEDILALTKEAAAKLPEEKRRARAVAGYTQRHYQMGLVDGAEITLAQISKLAAPVAGRHCA